MSALLSQSRVSPRARIVFYGTSLTRSGGWPEIIAAELAVRYPGLTAINAAGNGQHSRWGRENFTALVLAQAPDILFVEFAVNDAVARFSISQEEARANLEAMLDRLAGDRPDCAVVLQVMNPVIDRPRGHDGHRPELGRYEQIYRDVARERGVTLVDHAPEWAALLARGEKEFRSYVPDGLHPSPAGYEKFMLPSLRDALAL